MMSCNSRSEAYVVVVDAALDVVAVVTASFAPNHKLAVRIHNTEKHHKKSCIVHWYLVKGICCFCIDAVDRDVATA